LAASHPAGYRVLGMVSITNTVSGNSKLALLLRCRAMRGRWPTSAGQASKVIAQDMTPSPQFGAMLRPDHRRTPIRAAAVSALGISQADIASLGFSKTATR
jgi:hypothetical protein